MSNLYVLSWRGGGVYMLTYHENCILYMNQQPTPAPLLYLTPVLLIALCAICFLLIMYKHIELLIFQHVQVQCLAYPLKKYANPLICLQP